MPAVIETPDGDVIGIRQIMILSLSYDHRVIDGALAGGSLTKSKRSWRITHRSDIEYFPAFHLPVSINSQKNRKRADECFPKLLYLL
jgi:hypothetical protein